MKKIDVSIHEDSFDKRLDVFLSIRVFSHFIFFSGQLLLVKYNFRKFATFIMPKPAFGRVRNENLIYKKGVT